jgi:hypothetical protein
MIPPDLSKEIFEHLFVLGRPAGGKSEFIDFMKKQPLEERSRRFGIGRFEEVDDFHWLWEACLEDDRREKHALPRLVSERTVEGYNITQPKFRRSLVLQFNRVISNRYLANPAFYQDGTLLIEFARGVDDGFRESLELFLPDILRRAGILFIQVSFEESYRRNSARYRPGMEESTLFHKVPDGDMLGFFRSHDWAEITGGIPDGRIELNGVPVPFVTMNNEPESPAPIILGERYALALGRLREWVRRR